MTDAWWFPFVAAGVFLYVCWPVLKPDPRRGRRDR